MRSNLLTGLIIVLALLGVYYFTNPANLANFKTFVLTQSETISSTVNSIDKTGSSIGSTISNITQGYPSFKPVNPTFQNGKANVTYPRDYSILANYALGLINQDRAKYGLSPVTLSSEPSGQQHADSMAYFGYFSHWDTQGYKPYMRYTILGGTGDVAENIGFDYATTSSVDSTQVAVASCSIQTIEAGIANSEWQMMYNDLSSGNGHRDNILNPLHNKVSIGIAYDTSTSKIYFVEDFENSYINLETMTTSDGVVRLSGSTTKVISLQEVTVQYDPSPTSIDLNQPQYQGSYDSGTLVGAVFAPVPAGYTGSSTTTDGKIAVYADIWQSSGSKITIQFSLSRFKQQYGHGVYTLYLLDSQNNIWLSYSIFV
ncbi:MAG: CAP domain-containing protein [Candidatus Bathyarchaeia archaeon]|jgi:uncharacterized protein YkwD